MNKPPLVSFHVLSYNYERYIGQTLKSILNQTFQDFEVIVLDDGSVDGSVDVIRSFKDPRIKLHVSETNIGAAPLKIRAIELSQGRYVCHLDSDDWIDYRKTERQLEYFQKNPTADIVGTYVNVVDAQGNPHPRAAEIEAVVNRPHDFTSVDTWIVQNPLVHSSTMVRRSVFDGLGRWITDMPRAGDFEGWTRALRVGYHFGLVTEPLTFYRIHRNQTCGDPMEFFLEITYLLQKNLMPIVEKRDAEDSLSRMFHWILGHAQFALLTHSESCRLLAFLLNGLPGDSFAEYRAALRSDHPMVMTSGKRLSAAVGAATAEIARLRQGSEFHSQQAAKWQAEYDFQLQQARNWQAEYEFQLQQARNWQVEYENLAASLVQSQ